MTYNNPSLTLLFLGNDLAEGHSTSQTIDSAWIVNRSIVPSRQLLNGLKSSSDQFQLSLFRRCASIEDIIATEGNIKAELYEDGTKIFTGYISTSYSWEVTEHGEQALSITIESIGTRLFSQPFIETGYYFFDCPASAAVYNIIHPLGLSIKSGDERKIVQPVRKEVDAGTTCRQLLDALLYECNAVYSFNAEGELCITEITASTTGADEVDSSHLYNLNGKAISLSKSLRTYKGARIRYTETATASDYLVYRNTSGQDQRYPFCHLRLGAGEWYDGAEIYTDAEWTEATADAFREPTLISAVNASSESSIVGSNKIISISDASPNVVCEAGITVQIEAVGGKWFKITAHNTTNSDKYITRMDLYASIVYEKSNGVIRTQIDGTEEGKSLYEEELAWIHDKDNAQRHANLLAQYYKACGASYTFYSDLNIPLGSVIELHDDVFSGLDVFVLVYAVKGNTDSDLLEYKAVGISTFDLDEPTYHGTTQPAHQSGAQGPAGEPGATAEIQYAIGTSIINPPMDEMLWGGVEMLWGGDTMLWQEGLWTDEVPDMERGKYIWMRTRTGDSPWQYTRLTGSTSWDNENLGVCTTATPTTSKEGLGLIPGDYFIAGAQFTEDGVTYRKGFAYSYTGTGWSVLDLSDSNNSDKALQCLSDLMTSGINVTDSTASIWGWFQNLVAQNAVINQLVAEIAVLKQLIVTGDIDNDAITTSKATSATSLSALVTSVQDYYERGVIAGTCPQILISTISNLIPLGLSYATSGSITIDGTTLTATVTSPIKIERSETSLYIGSNRYYAEGHSSLGHRSPSAGYMMAFGRDQAISADSLQLPTSEGSAAVHDLVPKNSSADKVGTNDRPFLSGAFSSFTVKTAGQLNYKPLQVGSQTVSLYGTAGTWVNVLAISDDITLVAVEGQMSAPSGTVSFPCTLPYPSSNNFQTFNIKGEYFDHVCIFSFRKSNGYIQVNVDNVPSGIGVSAKVRTYK